jgi:catechol 2,3-dioxygenase-like lactoylglutathione lyase family enzyme
MTIRRVVPNITSNRLEESIAFYTELLGFKIAMIWGGLLLWSHCHRRLLRLAWSPVNPLALDECRVL